jgi:competence protein ComEC
MILITALLYFVLAPPAGTLHIYFIDVEGGAATLIVTPAGESLLIDTGWEREDGRDARRIREAAERAGIKRIDHLLTTHYHRDHWGGLGQLSKLMEIGRFYDHGRRTELAEDPQDFPKLNAAYQAASQGKSTALRPGDSIPLDGAEFRILASNSETVEGSGVNAHCKGAKLRDNDPTDNARSAGGLLTFGAFHFLDLGDLTWNIEQKLVCPANLIGKVDLYQVSHHGLAMSNNPVLLASVRPQVALVNNGPKKGGELETLQRLKAIPSLEAVYQLHRNLTLKAEQDSATDMIANLSDSEDCQGNFIEVAVAPGGGSYTVNNTRTGEIREFQAARKPNNK